MTFIGYNPLTIPNTGEDHYVVQLNRSPPMGITLNKEPWPTKGNRIFDPRFSEKNRRNVYIKRARIN